MKQIYASFESWTLILPRRGWSGRRLDFNRETPCKPVDDGRSLVSAESNGKCVEDELPKPSNAYQQKVPLRGTCHFQLCDQAANLFEVLAWSFSLKSVLRTAYIFRCCPRTPITLTQFPRTVSI